MSIDVMKQALEAPERVPEIGQQAWQLRLDAIASLRLAIEQAERQEPVCEYCGGDRFIAPPQRQPLTEEERNHLWETIYDHGNGKYQGEQSRAQRARAFEILKMIGGGG